MHTAVPSTGLVAIAAKGETVTSPNPAEKGTIPHMLIDAGGNKAAGSAAMSVATACPTTETLSSPGDDSSEDEAPSGKVPHSTPISKQLPP